MSYLNDKVIWITGASMGIGEAIARRLGGEGCRLALTARSKDRLADIAMDISRADGSALVLPGDVTKSEEMKAIAGKIEEEWGRVDVLIANAGTYIPTDGRQFESDHCTLMMNLNYSGALYCIEAVLPGMIARGAGHIVGVSSVTGYRGLPMAAGYGATKAALINFLEGLRFDLTGAGVAVTVVNPGFVKTPLTDKNEFKMPFLIPAEKAAEIIVRGISRKKREIHFPAPFSWTLKFLRILPFPIYEALVRRMVLK